MGIYSTEELTPEQARSYIMSKLPIASNEQLSEMMCAFAYEYSDVPNNFTVIDEKGIEEL